MPSDLTDAARRNHLLSGLPKSVLSRMISDFQLREMHVRDRVVGRGEQIAEVHFPTSCVLSTIAHGAAGEAVEVATVGNEGMAGLPVFLGNSAGSTLETFAQVPGDSLAMRTKDFRTHLEASPRLREVMGHYTQALLVQIAQTAACNRMHAAEERCARWLLMTHDRVRADDFELTQEFLAQMLGARSATVSEIANTLQSEGIIRYSRGVITVLNREALTERSCECYEIIREEYRRLLPPQT
jgi:CRP-like cAMP-binding protein